MSDVAITAIAREEDSAAFARHLLSHHGQQILYLASRQETVNRDRAFPPFL